MNTPIPHEPNAPTPDEREWQAQERALRRERDGHAPAGDEAVDPAYRRIAHALRQPPADALPRDFATQVAQRALASTRPVRKETHFERNLLWMLGAVLVLSGVVTMVIYGGSLVDSRAGMWCLAVMVCVAFSQSVDGLQQWLQGRDVAHRA